MMSIRETTILKGVAILFMLYLHLFNQMANVNLCTTYLSIRGVPFVHLCDWSSDVCSSDLFEWIWLVYFFQEWKKTKFIEKNFETLCSLLDYFDSFYSFRM